nr:hypothetical protein [Agrobacterium tumefaciens]
MEMKPGCFVMISAVALRASITQRGENIDIIMKYGTLFKKQAVIAKENLRATLL